MWYDHVFYQAQQPQILPVLSTSLQFPDSTNQIEACLVPVQDLLIWDCLCCPGDLYQKILSLLIKVLLTN